MRNCLYFCTINLWGILRDLHVLCNLTRFSLLSLAGEWISETQRTIDQFNFKNWIRLEKRLNDKPRLKTHPQIAKKIDSDSIPKRNKIRNNRQNFPSSFAFRNRSKSLTAVHFHWQICFCFVFKMSKSPIKWENIVANLSQQFAYNKSVFHIKKEKKKHKTKCAYKMLN